jgi:hypothetical protein
VRQGDAFPGAIVEVGSDGGAFGLTRFYKDGDGTEIEIFGRVGGVAEMKLPIFIQRGVETLGDAWSGQQGESQREEPEDKKADR